MAGLGALRGSTSATQTTTSTTVGRAQEMLTRIARSILSVLEEAATKSVEALDKTQRGCFFSLCDLAV